MRGLPACRAALFVLAASPAFALGTVTWDSH